MNRTAQAMFIALLLWHGALSAQTKETGPAQRLPSQAEQQVTAPATPSAPTVPAASDYHIGIDDVLAISVWRENDLARTVQVRTDGKIAFPLVGQVQAAGLTCQELQHRLTELLAKELRSPEVSVSVQEARSQRINVLGAVNRPGMYPLQKPMTVVDALALAGGLRQFAKTGRIFVLRAGPDGRTERIPFNYRKSVLEGKEAPSLELQARDTVVVP